MLAQAWAHQRVTYTLSPAESLPEPDRVLTIDDHWFAARMVGRPEYRALMELNQPGAGVLTWGRASATTASSATSTPPLKM